MSSPYSKEHQEIKESVDRMAKDLEYHIASVHEQLVAKQELEQADQELRHIARENRKQIDVLTDAVVGPWSPLLEHRDTKKGLVYKVDQLYERLGNGQAVRAKLTVAQQTALYSATLAVILKLFGVEIPLP